MIRAVGAIFALLVLSVLGCGGGSDSSSTISYRPFHFPRAPGGLPGRDAEVFLKLNENGLAGSEPKPVFPKGPPPEFVVLVELLDGANTPYARPGERVTVQYVAALYDSKEKVASSWDEGKPFTFTIGSGELMDGLEEGVEKIELADRREVVIPAEEATGGSRMKDIPRNTALIFVVEVLKIEKS
ncbi:MAG TPA: FKBP-type peptidyl-prolyl cis-trans isomerase [Solirubrobacterales bacterium]|nr:FKBP-type peptidyl-prolyl cis-trans isomerase [Solirubrobacterales bacterium]